MRTISYDFAVDFLRGSLTYVGCELYTISMADTSKWFDLIYYPTNAFQPRNTFMCVITLDRYMFVRKYTLLIVSAYSKQ